MLSLGIGLTIPLATSRGDAGPTGTKQDTFFSVMSEGANFATGSAALFCTISTKFQCYGFWGQTGTEGEPDFSGLGVTQSVPVALDPGDDITAVVAKFAAAMAIIGIGFDTSGSTASDLRAIDPLTGPRADATICGYTGALGGGFCGELIILNHGT